MAYPSWIPASQGAGMPRIGMGLFNASAILHRRQNGLTPKFFATYTGFNGTQDMIDNAYYGPHQADIAGAYTYSGTGIIPVIGTSLATVDGAMSLDSLASGANDGTVAQVINNAFGGSNYQEIWFRPGYEANIQTTAGGWTFSQVNWGPRWKAAFHRWCLAARTKMAQSFPNRRLRICFDTCVLNAIQVGANGNSLVLYKPDPVGINPTAGYDIMSVDFYTGNAFPLTLRPWTGYAAKTPFTLGQTQGAAVSGATVDSWAADFTPGAAPGVQGYTYDNMAHFLTFQDATDIAHDGGAGQNLRSMIQQATIDQVPMFHSEFGGIGFQNVNGAVTKGNGWADLSTTTIAARVPDDFRAMNDLNYVPYVKRIWATSDNGVGPPWLGAIIWDRSDGTLMSGPDAQSGLAHPGMRSTYQVLGYPLGQYGAIDPVLVVNDLPTLTVGVATTVRVDANFNLTLANLTVDFGNGLGPQQVQSIGGATLVGLQSATFPFTPNASGAFNISVMDTARGYPSPPSDYSVGGAVVSGGGGSAYRQTWHVGAWFDFVIQRASSAPSLTFLISISGGSCQFDYYVSTGDAHPFDGVLRQGISGGNLNIQGLSPNVKNNVRVYFSNNGNGAYSHVKVTGAQLDSASTSGQAITGLPHIKLYGDSISEAIFNHFTDCYWHIIAKSMRAYDFVTVPSSGSGWLVAGEGGASLHASWNMVDLTPSVTALDSNNHLSSYGNVNQEPAAVYTNMGTNEELHPQFTDAQIQSEVTARLIAFRGALKSSSVLSVIIPFGLYDTPTYPRGPQVITDIKNGIAPIAVSANVKIADLGSAFSAQLRTSSLTVDGIHLNKAGHVAAAQGLLPLVISQMGNVVSPPVQVTHAFTAAGGLQTGAFTFSNGNKTIHRDQNSGAANIWASVFADAIIPDGTKTYFEIDCTGCVTGTASGIAAAYAAGGFKTDSSSTNLNNPTYEMADGYNGSFAVVQNGVSTTLVNPRQGVGTSPPPGFQSTPGAGLEAFTYIDASGNVHWGYALINTSLPQANGNTQAHVLYGGAAGLLTTIGMLVDQINYQITIMTKVASTGFQNTLGPFSIPFRRPLTPNFGCQTGFLLSGGITATLNGGSAGFKIGLPAGYTAYDGTTGGVVLPPGGIHSILLDTIGVNNQVVAGQAYSFVGHADQPWSGPNAVLVSTQATSTGKVFVQANQVSNGLGGQQVTISSDGLTATVSNIASGLLVPHTAAMKDSVSGIESNNISYAVLQTAPPPLVIHSITATTSASSFVNSPYVIVGVADNPWTTADNVFISIQATSAAKNYVKANTLSGVTVAFSVDKKTVTVSGVLSGDAGAHTLYIKDSASNVESAGFAYTIAPVVVVPKITVISINAPIGIRRQDGLGQVNATEPFTISAVADVAFIDASNIQMSITPAGVSPVFTNPPNVVLSSDKKTVTITDITTTMVTTAVAIIKDTVSGTTSLGVNFVIAPAGTPPPVIIPPATIIDLINVQPMGVGGKVLTGSAFSIVAVADAPWKSINDVFLSITEGGTAQDFHIANGTANQTVSLSDDGFTAIISNVVANLPGDDAEPFVVYIRDNITNTVSAPATVLIVPVGTIITTGMTKLIIDPIGIDDEVEEGTFLTIIGHADAPFLSPDDVLVSTEVLVPTQFFVKAQAAGYTVTLSEDGLTATVSQIPAGVISPHIGYMEDDITHIESNGQVYEVVPENVAPSAMTKIALAPVGNTSANVLDTDTYSIFGVADAPWSDVTNVLISIQLVSAGVDNFISAVDAGYSVSLSSNNTIATVAGIVTPTDGDYIAKMQDSGTHIQSQQVNFHVIPPPVVHQSLITVQNFGNPVTATPFTVVGVADVAWSSAAQVQISLGAVQSFVNASTVGTVTLSNNGLIATVSNITAGAAGNYNAYMKDSGTGVISPPLPFLITPTVVTNPSMTQITMQPIGTNGSVVADTAYSMVGVADGPWSSAANVQISFQLSTAGQVWVAAQAAGLTVAINTTTRTTTVSGIVSHVQGTYTGYMRDVGTGISATSGMQYTVGPAAAIPMTQIVVSTIPPLQTGQQFSVSGLADHPWSGIANVLVSIGTTQNFVQASTTAGLTVAISSNGLTATVSGLQAGSVAGTSFNAYLRDSGAGITSAAVPYVVTTASPPLSVMTKIDIQSIGSPTSVTSGSPYSFVGRADGPWSSADNVWVSTQVATQQILWVKAKTQGYTVTISADKLTATVAGITSGIEQTHTGYMRDSGSGAAPGVTSQGINYEVNPVPVVVLPPGSGGGIVGPTWSEPPTVPVPSNITPGHTIRILGAYCNDNGASWNPGSSQTSSSGFKDQFSWKHGRDNFADTVGVSHAALNGGNIFTGTNSTHKNLGDINYQINLLNTIYTNPPYDMIPSIGVKMFFQGEVSPATGRTYGWNDGQAYIDIMNGLWDAYFTGCVDSMVQRGRTIFIFRPGYETNQAFMQDFSGYDNQSGQLSNWRKAMRRICIIMRNRAAQVGAYILIGFNPSSATQNNPNVDTSLALIGADAFNCIQFDIYNGYWVLPASVLPADVSGKISGVGPSQTELIKGWNGVYGGWYWNQCSAAARKYGMPIYLSEVGSSGGSHHMYNDPYFYPWLAGAINTHIAAGGTYIGINIWSVPAGDGNTNIQNGVQPATSASCAGVINTLMGQSFDPALIKFGGTMRVGAP